VRVSWSATSVAENPLSLNNIRGRGSLGSLNSCEGRVWLVALLLAWREAIHSAKMPRRKQSARWRHYSYEVETCQEKSKRLVNAIKAVPPAGEWLSGLHRASKFRCGGTSNCYALE
jgi:hypothetical protein